MDQWRSRLFSVYLGNINPVGKDQDLLAVVWKHGRVLDSYFPPSRAVIQKFKYGFVRFKEKNEALQVIQAIDGMLWNNNRIKASHAYPRKLSSSPQTKPCFIPPHRPLAKFSPPPPPSSNSQQPLQSQPLSNPKQPQPFPNPILIPQKTLPPLVLLKEDLESDWLNQCATAEVIHPANIHNLYNLLRLNVLVQFSVSFMGGSKVLLIFASRTDMLETLEKEETRLKVFFDYVTPWSPKDVAFDHYVWLKIENIPLHAWGSFLFKKIGNQLGTFIKADEQTVGKFNLDLARILILVNKDAFIPKRHTLIVDGITFEINISIDLHADYLWEVRKLHSQSQAFNQMHGVGDEQFAPEWLLPSLLKLILLPPSHLVVVS